MQICFVTAQTFRRSALPLAVRMIPADQSETSPQRLVAAAQGRPRGGDEPVPRQRLRGFPNFGPWTWTDCAAIRLPNHSSGAHVYF